MVRKESSQGDGTSGQGIATLRARFAGVIEAIGWVAQSWDLDTVLQEAANGARSLTGARYAAAYVFDDLGQGKT